MSKEIFKVGDKVYDIRCGWGKVKNTINGDGHPVLVDFINGKESYTLDGSYISDSNPSLSFTDYSGTEPFSQVRPLPDLKEGDLVYVRVNCKSAWHIRFFSHFHENKIHTFCNQKKEGNTIRWELYSIENPLL